MHNLPCNASAVFAGERPGMAEISWPSRAFKSRAVTDDEVYIDFGKGDMLFGCLDGWFGPVQVQRHAHGIMRTWLCLYPT